MAEMTELEILEGLRRVVRTSDWLTKEDRTELEHYCDGEALLDM